MGVCECMSMFDFERGQTVVVLVAAFSDNMLRVLQGKSVRVGVVSVCVLFCLESCCLVMCYTMMC